MSDVPLFSAYLDTSPYSPGADRVSSAISRVEGNETLRMLITRSVTLVLGAKEINVT